MFSADNLQLRERQKNIEAAHEIVCKGGSVTADKKKKNGKGKILCGDGKKVDKIRCTLTLPVVKPRQRVRQGLARVTEGIQRSLKKVLKL